MTEDLQDERKKILGFLVNRGRNHWVSIVVDVPFSMIYFGDPLGKRMDERLETVLKWWTLHHFQREFVISDMPTVKQNDIHSCGILSWDALRTHLTSKDQLVKPNLAQEERLKVMLTVISQHHSKVRCDPEVPKEKL